MDCPAQDFLDEVFPPQKTDAFFDALYGGAEEGAYDIQLVCLGIENNKAIMAFALKRRQGKCLKCSLTYGLPQVFERHPVIDLENVAHAIAEKLGWKNISWETGPVEEASDDLHMVPFIISACQK